MLCKRLPCYSDEIARSCCVRGYHAICDEIARPCCVRGYHAICDAIAKPCCVRGYHAIVMRMLGHAV